MGPPPRSLAVEADDCFMVRVQHGSNRIQGRGAMLASRPMGGLPSGRSHRKLDIQIPIQGFVRDAPVRAVLTAFDMPAQRRRSAALDCAHHLQLVEADVSAVGFTPSGTVVAVDIRDLQNWPAHVGGAYAAGSGLCLFLGRW